MPCATRSFPPSTVSRGQLDPASDYAWRRSYRESAGGTPDVVDRPRSRNQWPPLLALRRSRAVGDIRAWAEDAGRRASSTTTLLPFNPIARAIRNLYYVRVAGDSTRLNAGGETVPGTVIESANDEVVTPYTSAFLSGPNVTNILLQSQCPLDQGEHLSMPYDHRRHRRAERARPLAPDHTGVHAGASRCGWLTGRPATLRRDARITVEAGPRRRRLHARLPLDASAGSRVPRCAASGP
jgi:hypothetical protein